GEGGGGLAGRRGRDAVVHGVSAGTLVAGADEQRAGTAAAGGPAPDARGRELPGRRVGGDAGGGAVAARGGHALGVAPLPGHGPAAGAGEARRAGGVNRRGGGTPPPETPAAGGNTFPRAHLDASCPSRVFAPPGARG